MSECVCVVLAVLRYQDWFLLARRHKQVHQGGKLEFVGGKVHPNESTKAALVREVAEEIGISIEHKHTVLLGTFEYSYPDRKIRFWVYQVALDTGCFEYLQKHKVGKQGQEIFWADKDALQTLAEDMPKANRTIVDWLFV